MFEDGLGKAQTALFTSMGCAVILPAAWELVSMMYLCQCDPGAYHKGSEVWADVAKSLHEKEKELEKVIADIPKHDWDGEDRKAFEDKMKDFRAQVGISATMADVTHYVLLFAAWVLYILIVIMMITAIILVAQVVYVGIVAASTLGTGYWGAVGEICLIIEIEMVPMFTTVTDNVDIVMNAAAAILGTTLVVDIGAQMVSGNPGAALDLIQAQVPAFDAAWRGALQRMERDLTGYGMKYDQSGRLVKLPWPVVGGSRLKGGSDSYGESPSYGITGGLTGKESPEVG
jgi:hypothetical protein